ncbi:MAG TPA: PilC/PilY family type IV pilus protein [Verrucomicrobiae bacterium]|nr:PilC/PilY family type IV pilus protein [Verrucomicrobiae bacterium]
MRTVVTQTSNVTTVTSRGETNACYNDAVTCNPADVSGGCPAGSFNGGCTCTAAGSTTGCAAGNTNHYMVQGTSTNVAAQPTGTYTAAPAGPLMMDEWARFMRQRGVTIPGLSARNQVTTYVIDVFKNQQSPELSGMWFNAARVGGGKYFQAKDKNAILKALREIFTEVQAVNSAFSSASLPINATNRSQNENQIFIGVFKPDRTKDPLWFGNLKRFQAIRNNAEITLGDSTGAFAINNQTGFLNECATSFWSTDTGNYWERVITDDPEALGICTTNATNDYSDAPDGPFVEKGAAAEVVRKGNNPSAVPDGSGNYALNRSVKTLSGGALAPLTAAIFDDGNAATDETAEGVIVDFIKGADIDNDDLDTNTTEPRSTIHGDVVHSRPQPVNYGGTTGVVVYYGANDGLFRAVKASNGQELWSFVAPEHFTKLPRLRFSGKSGNPLVKYFGDTNPGAQPKDYFFDGSTGLFQSFAADDTSSKALIFPTQRRGGRRIYAFNVTDPAAPAYLWSRGCPNLTNDTGCDADFTNIGQTWSLASVAFLQGYSTTRPVVITGGGYDRCDDDDSRTPCSATKGRGVYVIDAEDGTLVKYFDFSTLSGVGARGVAADIALISMNPDKFVDYAYAVDTGGNVYRMDFTDGYGTLNGVAPASWTFSRVAYTNGAARKFLFPPALLQNGDRTVYLAIGTGDREHPLMGNYPFGTSGDASSAVVNRFYVFKDNISDLDTSTATNLDSVDPPHNMKNYTTDPGCSGEKITPGSAKTGWFMDLVANGQGEQVVTSAVIATGVVNFSTNRPTPPAATACSSSLGEARGYEVNLLNRSGGLGIAGNCGGTSSSIFTGGGLPPSPVIATIRIGDRVDTIVIGAPDPEGGAGSFLDTTERNPVLDSKRRPVYWYKSTGEQ